MTPHEDRQQNGLARIARSVAYGLALVLGACGGGDGEGGRSAVLALVRLTLGAPGLQCSNGGSTVAAGVDTNNNAVLEESEVTSKQYVCNGTSGATDLSTLVATTEEPAGAHCSNGGSKIATGRDANANGVLDSAEMSSIAYVCSSAVGPRGPSGAAGSSFNSLTAVAAEPAGANCSRGGSKITLGQDVNVNSVLDDAEVTSTQYVCNGAGGPTGLATLLATASEPAGMHCSNGGSKISAGLDTNGNGALDAAEILSIAYVCNGAPGLVGATGATGATGAAGATGATGATGLGVTSLVSIAVEPAGANCSHGGSKVTSGLDANANGLLDAGEVSSSTFICNGPPGPGLVRVDVTSSTVQAQSNTGYLANSATQVVVTLPVAPANGDVVQVSGGGTGGWKIAQNAGQSIVTRALPSNLVLPGANWLPHGNAAGWTSIASSADGQRLAAVGLGDQIHTSTDAGLTWTARESFRSWWSIVSSADGSKLAAVAGGDQIYTSSDSGLTWSARESARDWRSIASSTDGNMLVALENGGQIYTSTDAGVNWVPRDAARNWSAVASSADGSRLVALESGGLVYTSTDAGVSWIPRDSARPWVSVASSADGNLLVAAEYGGQIYTSTDAGLNWAPRETMRQWARVASSADGTKLFASDFGGRLYTSANAGLAWTPRESVRQWYAVASSADGNWLAAAEFGDLIYTSVGGRTTPGITGSLSGAQYDAIELQYVGGGTFIPLDSHSDSGAFVVQ